MKTIGCQDFGEGSFLGKVVGFDGEHYEAYYSDDSDYEHLSEDEFRDLEILKSTPSLPKYPPGTRFMKVSSETHSISGLCGMQTIS